MNILILGGSGLQGRAVISDLSKQERVKRIVCGDIDFELLDKFKEHIDMNKIEKVKVDATNLDSIVNSMKDVDVTIDLFPKQFHKNAAEAALIAGVSLVNCSYAQELPEDLSKRAIERGITIMPESGLDPGIDLILCGYGVSQLDEVSELYSYCGGVSEEEAADNALKYKISWNWESTLKSYKRPAKIMKNQKVIDIPATDQHSEKWLEHINFPGVGEMEIIPNGDALVFTKVLGIENTIKNTERRTIRWKGHASFWEKMSSLGFLEEENINSHAISPLEFMKSHLEPRLQYKSDEKDLTLMQNIIIGEKNGEKVKLQYDLIDERDLTTGLFAMNRTVGYTASIIAQMIADNEIVTKGVLSPVKDVPFETFISRLGDRGIKISSKRETI